MSYPDWFAGSRLTAAKLQEMVDSVVIKAAPTARTSTTTCTADTELQGIALGVGTWDVRATLLYFLNSAATTVNMKVKWTFSGVATGYRDCLGIAAGSTSTSSASMRSIGSALSTEQTYGVTDTFNHVVRENGLLIVTTAGNLSIDFAQGTSSANSVSLATNSSVKYRRIV